MEDIPNYPTLFSEKRGKTYVWGIKIMQMPIRKNVYSIIVSHGVQGGKKVVHETIIDKGNANRSTLEQAILEASRKWRDKKEKELYREAHEENQIYVRPMLAQKWNIDKPAFAFPVMVQRKFDGIRCISYILDGACIIETRKGVPIDNFEELRRENIELIHSISRDLEINPYSVFLDGELYTNELEFETISGLIRISSQKATQTDLYNINQIQYHIYDIVLLEKPQMSFRERNDIIQKYMCKIENRRLCCSVETRDISNPQDIMPLHNAFVNEGFEGIMIRNPSSPYEINKRSRNLMKYKEFMEEEFEIVGFHDGEGAETGAVIWECKTSENVFFSVRPRGTIEKRKQLYIEATRFIGCYLTVMFQEYQRDGCPRFPIGKAIRTDL